MEPIVAHPDDDTPQVDPFEVVKSARPLCTCDCQPDWANYSETIGINWKRKYVTHGQVEGTGAFYITYGFRGG